MQRALFLSFAWQLGAPVVPSGAYSEVGERRRTPASLLLALKQSESGWKKEATPHPTGRGGQERPGRALWSQMSRTRRTTCQSRAEQGEGGGGGLQRGAFSLAGLA